jgi:hypothetical protein
MIRESNNQFITYTDIHDRTNANNQLITYTYVISRTKLKENSSEFVKTSSSDHEF